MKESTILNDIKRNLYNKTMENYNIYVLNKTQTNKEIYERLLKIYKKVNSFKTLQEVSDYLSELYSNILELKKIFDAKVEEYNKDKKNKELQQEVKNIMDVAQALTDVYSETKSKISRYNKTQKSNISVKFRETKQPEKEEKIETPKVEKYIDGVDFNNETIQKLEKINSEILSLRIKLVTFDVYSKEALEIRKRINELCEIREHIAYEINGYDGIKFIKNIESMEIQYANMPNDEKKQEKEMDAESYKKELMDKLLKIADLKFFGIESKYINVNPNDSNKVKFEEFKKVFTKYMKEYTSLVRTLFGNNPVIYKNYDYIMHESDLRNLFEIYNLRGNYHDFKKKHKTGKIGNEAISKELYTEGLDRIDGLINSLMVLVNETIKQKGGTVKVTYDLESKETIKAQIDKNMIEFYKQVCDKNKNISI